MLTPAQRHRTAFALRLLQAQRQSRNGRPPQHPDEDCMDAAEEVWVLAKALGVAAELGESLSTVPVMSVCVGNMDAPVRRKTGWKAKG